MPEFHLFSTGPRPVAPFSHAVEADGWVILTGQMPTDPDAPDAPLPEGVEAQTIRVMENLSLILGEMGLDLSHVVQCRCFLTEFERDYAAFNETYQSYFPEDRRPARTTVGVTALAVGGAGRDRLHCAASLTCPRLILFRPRMTRRAPWRLN